MPALVAGPFVYRQWQAKTGRLGVLVFTSSPIGFTSCGSIELRAGTPQFNWHAKRDTQSGTRPEGSGTLEQLVTQYEIRAEGWHPSCRIEAIGPKPVLPEFLTRRKGVKVQ